MKKWEKPKVSNIGIENTNSCRAWIGLFYAQCLVCGATSSYTLEEISAGGNNLKCKQPGCEGDVTGCKCPSTS